MRRGEDGWWIATSMDIPEAIGQGRTEVEAESDLARCIRYLAESGTDADNGPRVHELWTNPATGAAMAVPLQDDLDPLLVRIVCEGLGIPDPPG